MQGMTWFEILMVITFLGALAALASGIASIGKSSKRSTLLMAARVGLCLLLLVEILIYSAFFKA